MRQHTVAARIDPASARWSDLQNGAQYAGLIVPDPDPDDPFPGLQGYLAWLAACTLLPVLGGVFLLLRVAWRRPADKNAQRSRAGWLATVPLAAWCLVLSVPPAYGLLEYGRVSREWTLALKVILALAILGTIIAVGQFCVARRWLAAGISTVILIGWAYFMFFPWWFL
jgi:hypothetical protein